MHSKMHPLLQTNVVLAGRSRKDELLEDQRKQVDSPAIMMLRTSR